MDKWEYLDVRYTRVDGTWVITKINGKQPEPPYKGNIYNFMSDYGNQGWELVSDHFVEVNTEHSFNSINIDRGFGSNNFSSIGDDGKKVDIFDYMNNNCKSFQIVGVIPEIRNGFSHGGQIIISKKRLIYERILIFKRKLNNE